MCLCVCVLIAISFKLFVLNLLSWMFVYAVGTDARIFYFNFSWYFDVNRGEANDILNAQPDSGTFLVRPSNTLRGDLVLCVK